MTTENIISGFCPALSLMGRVWLKYNRVFNGFYFLKSDMDSGRVRVLLFLVHPDYILKIYFIIILFYTLI